MSPENLASKQFDSFMGSGALNGINTLGQCSGGSSYNKADLQFLIGVLSTWESNPAPHVLAERMLDVYGSFSRLLSAPEDDIAAIEGIGLGNAKLIKSSYATIVNTVFAQLKEKPSLDYDALIAMALWEIGESPVEKVLLFYLDNRHRVLGSDVICSGSESCVSVSVKMIIAAVCRKNAASFVVAHNHPSGSVIPSRQDLEFTDNLLRVSAMIELRLIENIIVSGNKWYSFREQGHL